MAPFAVLVVTVLLAGTPPVAQSVQVHPLISNLLDEFLKDILPSQGPCMFDYFLKEVVRPVRLEVGVPLERIPLCVSRFPQFKSKTDLFDFVVNSTKVCQPVKDFVRCILTDSDIPCVSGLRTKLEPFIAKVLTFWDCDVDEQFMLDVSNCIIRPLVKTNRSAFEDKVGQCAIGTGLLGKWFSPLPELMDLYDNYVATQGNQSNICRIGRDFFLCALQAYNETVWKSAQCNNVQSETMRQLDDILDKLNCHGNRSGDVLTCLGNPALYTPSTYWTSVMCRWSEHFQTIRQGLTSLWQLPKRATVTQLVSQFVRVTCSSLNTLGQCTLQYLNASIGCNKTVVPTLANIITPLLDHINRASSDNDTCPVNEKGTTMAPPTVTQSPQGRPLLSIHLDVFLTGNANDSKVDTTTEGTHGLTGNANDSKVDPTTEGTHGLTDTAKDSKVDISTAGTHGVTGLGGSIIGGLIFMFISVVVVLIILWKRKCFIISIPKPMPEAMSDVVQYSAPMPGIYEEIDGTHSEPYETLSPSAATQPDPQRPEPHTYTDLEMTPGSLPLEGMHSDE